MRNMQNFYFHPKRPSSVLRITESPKTSRFVISVFQIKIRKFMRDRQNFHFPLKTAQFRFLVLYVIFNLSIDYISVPDKNMPNFTFLPKVAHYCVQVFKVSLELPINHICVLEINTEVFGKCLKFSLSRSSEIPFTEQPKNIDCKISIRCWA